MYYYSSESNLTKFLAGHSVQHPGHTAEFSRNAVSILQDEHEQLVGQA